MAIIDEIKTIMTLDTSGWNISGVENSLKDLNRSFEAFGKRVQEFGRDLSELGQKLTIGITAPLLAAGGASIKFGADFELGLRQVTSLLGATSAEADKTFRTMSEGVLELSRRLGVDAVGATQALYEAISAGVPQDNALTFLDTASKAAIAGVTSTKVAVDGLTTVINAYQLEASRAGEVSDAMFQAVNIGKVTFEQLSASIGQAAPLAAQLGVSFKELLASMATITKQGVSGSEAFTQISSALRAMIDPSEKMKELFEKMGVASGKALIEAKGFQGALVAIREAAQGNETVLSNAFGRIEALRATLSLTGKNAAGAAADFRTLKESVGATDNALREINKTASRQFEILTANVKAAAIEFGNGLAPAVASALSRMNGLTEVFRDLVGWFSKLAPQTRELVGNLGLMASAAGPAALAFGKITQAIGSMVGAGGSIGIFMGALANVATAVQFNLVGALTLGEKALLGFGVAAAAFAGWQLGKWAYDQIPGMKTLADVMFGWLDGLAQRLGQSSGRMGDAFGELVLQTDKLAAALASKGVIVERGTMSLEEYSKALRRAGVNAGLMKEDLAQVAKGLTELLKFEFTGDVLAKGANESLEQWVARLKQAAVSVGLLGEESKKAAPKIDTVRTSVSALVESKVPAWQKQISDGWKEWDAQIENLRGRVRGLMEAFGETDIPREFLGPLADQLEQLGEQDLRKLQESLQRLMAQEEQIADGWADWARETENLRGKIRGLAEEFRALEIPEEFAGSLASLSTLTEEGLQELEPVLARLIEQQKAINDGWSDWAAADAKVEASIESLQAALQDFGVTMERTSGETLEDFQNRVAAELEAQKSIAEGWKQLGEEEAREAAKVSEVYRRFAQAMSATVDQLSSDIARNLTSLRGLADAFKDWALSIKDSILNLVIDQALKPLKNFIEDVVTPAIGNFVTRTLGFGASAAGTAAGAAGSAAGAAGSVAGAAGSVAGGAGGMAGTAGGLVGNLNLISGIAGAAGSIAGAVIGYKTGQDIAALEVTARGQLNEALNIRADLWDQFTKAAVQLDSLFSFTWVKLDEIITSIRNWVGTAVSAASAGPPPGPTGSTTPGIPEPFPGGAGQGPAIAGAPEVLPPGWEESVQSLVASAEQFSTISSEIVRATQAMPQAFGSTQQELGRFLSGQMADLAAGLKMAGEDMGERSADMVAGYLEALGLNTQALDRLTAALGGSFAGVMIPAAAGGHDSGGVGSATASYRAYYRAMEALTYGPRERGTQGNPFGGGSGVAALAERQESIIVNFHNHGGVFADDASKDRLALDMAERINRARELRRIP